LRSRAVIRSPLAGTNSQRKRPGTAPDLYYRSADASKEGILRKQLSFVEAGARNVRGQQEQLLKRRQEKHAFERSFPAHWDLRRIRSGEALIWGFEQKGMSMEPQRRMQVDEGQHEDKEQPMASDNVLEEEAGRGVEGSR
jgi:hypothetical protein